MRSYVVLSRFPPLLFYRFFSFCLHFFPGSHISKPRTPIFRKLPIRILIDLFVLGPISFPESVALTISQCGINLFQVVRVFDAFGKSSMTLATSEPDVGVPGPKLHEALLDAVESVGDNVEGGIEFTTKNVAAALTKIR